MIWTFILWLNILQGFSGLQSQTITQNPLEGYTIQKTQESQIKDVITFAPIDSEEDSEDSDEETDSVIADKEFTSSTQLRFQPFPLHIFEYNDLLSQAHLNPILTPPDTRTKN